MASVKAFNDMMEQFLNELRQTFPEEKAVVKYQTAFDLLRKSNPRQCVNGFMASISAHSDKIMQKDDTFITEGNFEFTNEVNIGKYWNGDLSENTKAAIWQYIQTLNILGMTITSIPQETLDTIESVASQCAESMQGGGGDEKALMNSMSGLLGSLGGMFPTNK